MTRFVIVWTLQRGIIDPTELLDDANQYRANLAAETQEQSERDILRRRATRDYQLERDPDWKNWP